jgi:carbon-monoxide dehydrogenase large subunit
LGGLRGTPGRGSEKGAAARHGLRPVIEPAGGVSPTDEVAITFERDGGILLHEVAIASGQGHETVLPEIVGRALQIDPVRITSSAGRADGPVLKGAGAFGSRSMRLPRGPSPPAPMWPRSRSTRRRA